MAGESTRGTVCIGLLRRGPNRDGVRQGSGSAVILLERDAQPVCQTIHEVEVGRHFDDLEQSPVVEARLAKPLEVVAPHPARLEGELFGEGKDSAEALIHSGGPPLPAERPDEIFIPRDQTERRPVMLDSVVAPVRGGDHHRDRLAFRT